MNSTAISQEAKQILYADGIHKTGQCSFSIDDDDVATVVSDHDIVVEELPSDYDSEAQVHDQLPTVEEARASLGDQPSSIAAQAKRRKICLVATCVMALVAIIALSIGASSKSQTPSSYEPTGRFNDVVEFIFDNGISTLPSLKDQYTAEHRAALFIADGDLYQSSLSDENVHRFVERYILALLYYQFNGAEWKNNYHFLSGRDHCEWTATETRPAGTFIKGVSCDADGYVVGLDLSNNNLVSNFLPSEVHHLTHLESLHLYKNKITGYLPEEFQHMKKLKSLGLMDNGMKGTIPEWVGDLNQLTTLALGRNDFHSTIPATMANLQNMRVLGLEGMGISGSISSLKGLKNLEALYLEDNKLTGNLEGSDLWPRLKELDVSNNMLDGTVPSAMFHNSHLVVLDVNRNLFYGDFPDDIVANDSLQYVSLAGNSLSGSVSDRVGFLTNLKHLDVSFNVLTGTLPDTIKQLTDLVYLATSANDFSSQGMMDLSGLTSLRDLSMKRSNLTGHLPDWLAMMGSLKMLDVDGNSLSGSIPTWLGLMSNLEYLLLNRNELTGTIPSHVSHLRDLKVLLLDGNNITGHADAICERQGAGMDLAHFVADCYPGKGGERPEVECRCCTLCCTDDDPACNDRAWTAITDPKASYGYIRSAYEFSLDQAAEEWAETAREEALATTGN